MTNPFRKPNLAFAREEPVVTAATILSLVGAVLLLLRAYGVVISEDQHDAILAVVSIAGPLVAGWWARRRVTPS